MSEVQPTILCVGPSHHTASLAARERFALVGAAARELCARLAARDEVDEIASLATCNRSELYVVTRSPEQATTALVETFAELAGFDEQEIGTLLAVRADEQAVEHVLRVAGGIESVVVGEAQIQGQLRQALEAAHEGGTCGPLLDRLLRAALEVGKRARRETTIGAGRASVGSVAAELVAERLGGSLAQARIVVLGAGKMGGLAARSLADRGARQVDVANRSVERARVIAEECGGEGVAFTEVDEELVVCDAVVSSTNAPHVLISKERMETVMARRGGRRIVLVDLAVPRDIDAACGQVPGVHLFDLDDLERVVSTTLETRTAAIDEVAAIAREGAEEFGRWRRGQDAVDAIRELREGVEQIRQEEHARYAARLAHLSDDDRDLVERLTRSIARRVLHEPTTLLREAAQQR